MQELGKLKFNINVMPNGLEKYVTFNPTMPGGGGGGGGASRPAVNFCFLYPKNEKF